MLEPDQYLSKLDLISPVSPFPSRFRQGDSLSAIIAFEPNVEPHALLVPCAKYFQLFAMEQQGNIVFCAGGIFYRSLYSSTASESQGNTLNYAGMHE
jgi:hypothetical protein